jgi:hypothetical protein
MKWFVSMAISAIALGAIGCGQGDTTSSTDGGSGGSGAGGTSGSGGTGGSGGGLVCPDDPSLGDVAEECGVWVSASLGKDDNPGTQAAPVASLTQAIALAKKGPGRVYACGEAWTGPLVLPGGISLHGGFDCAGGWAYKGEESWFTLTAGPDEVPLNVVAGEAGAGRQWVTHFRIQAADATVPSGSSMGIFVHDDVETTFRIGQVIAGNGADGLDGDAGEPDDLPAPNGPAGKPGMNACSAPVSEGGASPEAMCPAGENTNGGKGGNGGVGVASSGGLGMPVNEQGGGKGGAGEESAPSCANGEPGANGEDGAFGLGGERTPRLTANGYEGKPGGDGTPGMPAQGGGGGGATFGKAAACGMVSPGGGGGGSGGAGGCGGKAGKGGRPGGASICIASRAKTAHTVVEHLHWILGNGGNGGNGAYGQPGGLGGAAGLGGAGAGMGAGAVHPGCNGGKGGDGGAGGFGGGGAGGDSVGIAWGYGGAPGLDGPTILFEQGKGGQGGLPGAPADMGAFPAEDGAEQLGRDMKP